MDNKKDAVIEAARALAISLGAGIYDHMLGIKTYENCPPEGAYEEAHRDIMVTFAEEKFSYWIPLHERLRVALEELDKTDGR